MKLALACVTVLFIACGSKTKPATAPAATSAGSGSAASCCCELADKSTKMEAPGECTAAGGTCEATDDSCHGIEGPIP